MADLNVTLPCPECGGQSRETMPTDRCVFFYDCSVCRVVLRPKPGDCCVFCSYGDRRCPFVQDDLPAFAVAAIREIRDDRPIPPSHHSVAV